MSFRAIEDLVDDSLDVLAIARAAGDQADVRGLSASLFAFSDRHDTQFTRFRDIERLIEHGFVYRLPTTCYPGARELESALATNDLVWVGPEPKGGYVSLLGQGRETWLYVEAGSPMWRELVTMGLLTGHDTVQPRILPPIDLAVAMAELAVAHDAGWLAVDWYALITVELDGMTDAGIRRHAKLKRLRALAAPHAERLAGLETYVREAFDGDLADWWLKIGAYQPVGRLVEPNPAPLEDWAAWWLSASASQPEGQLVGEDHAGSTTPEPGL